MLRAVMPHISDFIARPVLIPAVLLLLALIPNWRGLHLAGDVGYKSRIWGIFFLICVLLSWGFSASGYRDAQDEVQASATDAKAAKASQAQLLEQLKSLQNDLASLNQAMNRLASVAKVDPNQSAEKLADTIAAKIDSLQKHIQETQDRVNSIEHPPIDPLSFYQNGQKVGQFSGINYDPINNVVTIENLTPATVLNFPAEIDIDGDLLACGNPVDTLFVGFSSSHPQSFGQVQCKLLGRDPQAPPGAQGLLATKLRPSSPFPPLQ